MNLFLFRKYWSKHKSRLISLILSIILFTAAAVFSVLNERAELRRELHEMYDLYGNYALVVHEVTPEQGEIIRKKPGVERIGIVSAIGTIELSDGLYTIGTCENEEAENSLHFHFNEGNFPEKSGQIAMPEFILRELFTDAKIGDILELEITDFNNNKISTEFELSGIIAGNSNRTDMDYLCSNGGTTVTKWDVENPTPSIYIYYGDAENYEKYYNYLISPSDESYFNGESDAFFNQQDGELELPNEVTSGYKNLIMLQMEGADDNEGLLSVEQSDNIKILHIIELCMLIIAAISMFSGVYSIMPDRIESLRLLRSIGMSKKKLLEIFITEFFIFWAMGNILGIALGCGVHELVTVLQKSLGILAYRGYFAEYAVSIKTSSPFILPVFLSLIIAAAALIIPVKSIITMTFYKKIPAKKSSQKIKNFRSAFSKITAGRFVSALSCLSIVIVICSTIFGYCYYTETNKGTTYFSIGKESASAAYYKAEGIDLKENNIDCIISAKMPSASGMAIYDKEYGITAAELNKLNLSANVLAWGIYPGISVIYGEDEDAPKRLADSIVELSDKWEFYDEYKKNALYNVTLLFLDNEIMEMLGANSDDVIIIASNYNFPYEVGDTVPMRSCLTDEYMHVRLDTEKKFNAEITAKINTNTPEISENNFIKESGIFNFASEYAIAMTAEKAEEIGFYYPGYCTVTLDFYDDLSDSEMRDYVSNAVNKTVRTTTIHQLEKNARISKLSANANSIILFILLFILCVISIWNLLKMQVQNNIQKFWTLHSIGISYKKIKKFFVENMMVTVVISVLIGTLISICGKLFLTSKYNEYYSLLAQQQELYGNDDFPSEISGLNSAYMEVSDPLYDMTVKMENLREKFLLDNEMWLPEIVFPLCVICAVIIISTLICSILTANKIKNLEVHNND